MRISGQGGPGKKKRGMTGFFLVIIIILAAVWIDASMRPAIENIVAYQAKVFAVSLVNKAMTEQMERDGISYSQLVKITRGSDGEITSLEADMVQINRLKSRMSESAIKSFENIENHEIGIPVGTIIGNQFTSGRGPLVNIKVVPTGYVQSEIYNNFSAAGINQTSHQIMLQITVQMAAVLPGYSVKTETVTNFCIAETVIVGKIPQGYASLDVGAATFAPVEK